MKNQADIIPTTAKRKLTPEEQSVVDYVAKAKGRELTEEEINLTLEQARSVGNLD